jgi:hypothetical protein
MRISEKSMSRISRCISSSSTGKPARLTTCSRAEKTSAVAITPMVGGSLMNR